MRQALRRAVEAVFWTACLLFLITLGYNSLTRRDTFQDPDTMNFVDVSRNLLAGRGLTQSTLGFNQPRFSTDDPIPAPFTSQPPLYPILIASLARLGAPVVDAGLLISVLAFGMVLVTAHQLAQELYGGPTAKLALALLLLYGPLEQFASTAFSETTGLLFVFLTLWLVARWARTGQALLVAAAGLTAGLGFATRYALLPLVGVGVVVILLSSKAKWRDLSWFGIAFAAPAGLIWAHNWFASGALMPSPNHSEVGLLTNAILAFNAVFGTFWPGVRFNTTQQLVIFFAGLALVGLWLTMRRRLLATVRAVFVTGRRYVLPLWAAVYLAFLILQRTVTHFDKIGPRLVLPAVGVLLAVLAALLMLSFQVKPELVAYGVVLLALVALVRETWFTVQTPRVDRAAPIVQSALLSWVGTDTTGRDLIVGPDTVYVPFYFGQRRAVSVSPFPYSDYLAYQHLMDYAGKHCGEYEHLYLIVQDMADYDEARWEASFGPFLADIALGRLQNYPGIEFLRHLNDGSVFAIHCR